VIELLRPYDCACCCMIPYVTDAEAAVLGSAAVGIRDLFERSDVVSVHTPLLPPPVAWSAGN